MGEKQFHIACQPGDVGRFCILPGDPGRCEKIAAYFEDARLVASNREYTTYTGMLHGIPVSVVSTGIGGPSAAIAMEELVALGADTFIRIGSCGGIDLAVQGGDCVIAQATVRQDGASREYAPLAFPAVADFSVTQALACAADELGIKAHIGVVQSKDSFYGQHRPETMATEEQLKTQWEAWKRLGVLASEMECAALYTVAATRKVRCGGVLQVYWNQERRACGMEDKTVEDCTKAIEICIRAMKCLIDRECGL